MAAGKHMANPGQQTNQRQGATPADIAKRGWIKFAVSVAASVVATLAAAVLLIVGLAPFPNNPILGAAAGRLASGLVILIIFS